MKSPAVYILTNRPNGTLYIGVTSNLSQRIEQHRAHAVPGFTQKYNCDRLVYFEACDSMEAAIIREKRLKNGHREWKVNLIEKDNPNWQDLSDTLA